MRSKLLYELIKHGSGNVSMGTFTATKDHFYLYFVSLFKEFCGLFHADLQVPRANAHRETDSFDFHLFALCTLLSHFLFLLVFEVAVVCKLTYWRLGQRRNFNKIHAFFLGKSNGLCGGQNAKRIAFIINNTHLWGENKMVCLELLNFELWLLEPSMTMNAHGFVVVASSLWSILGLCRRKLVQRTKKYVSRALLVTHPNSPQMRNPP